MDVAVGVRRAVVEDEARPALAGGAQPPVKAEAVPALKDRRLLLRQAGAHREVGLGQKQRFRVIARFCRRVAHGAPSNKPFALRKGAKAADGEPAARTSRYLRPLGGPVQGRRRVLWTISAPS